MKNYNLRSLKGFTLIELLIVITIIGVLAVALLPRITAGPAKARDAQRKTDLAQVAGAIVLLADDNGGAYPSASCVSAMTLLTSYMTSIPTDPVSTSTITPCSTPGSYGYYKMGNGFLLVAKLETLSATGSGIYDKDAPVPTSTSQLSSAWITAAANYLCGGTSANCASDTYTMYVLTR